MSTENQNHGRIIIGTLIGIIVALFSCVIVIGGLLLAFSEGGVRLSPPEPSSTDLLTSTLLASSTSVQTFTPQLTETSRPTETTAASSPAPTLTSSPTPIFTSSPTGTFTSTTPPTLPPTSTPTFVPPPTLAPTLPPPQPPPGCGPSASWVIYIVQPGDTLSSIGRTYGVTVEQLKFANCLALDTIYVGKQLYVPNIPPQLPTSTNTLGPVATNTPSIPATALPTNTLPPPIIPTQPPIEGCGPPASWVIYTVQAGDTIASISSAFNVTTNQLMYANCLTSTAIYPGQFLYVPPR